MVHRISLCIFHMSNDYLLASCVLTCSSDCFIDLVSHDCIFKQKNSLWIIVLTNLQTKFSVVAAVAVGRTGRRQVAPPTRRSWSRSTTGSRSASGKHSGQPHAMSCCCRASTSPTRNLHTRDCANAWLTDSLTTLVFRPPCGAHFYELQVLPHL